MHKWTKLFLMLYRLMFTNTQKTSSEQFPEQTIPDFLRCFWRWRFSISHSIFSFSRFNPLFLVTPTMHHVKQLFFLLNSYSDSLFVDHCCAPLNCSTSNSHVSLFFECFGQFWSCFLNSFHNFFFIIKIGINIDLRNNGNIPVQSHATPNLTFFCTAISHNKLLSNLLITDILWSFSALLFPRFFPPTEYRFQMIFIPAMFLSLEDTSNIHFFWLSSLRLLMPKGAHEICSEVTVTLVLRTGTSSENSLWCSSWFYLPTRCLSLSPRENYIKLFPVVSPFLWEAWSWAVQRKLIDCGVGEVQVTENTTVPQVFSIHERTRIYMGKDEKRFKGSLVINIPACCWREVEKWVAMSI